MSKNSAFDMIAQFMGRQNTIPVPMPFVRILGDYTSAAFLSQCIYWCDRTDDAGGWFYKSHDEWAAELELSSDQVRRCVKTCGGMVEVKRAGIPARNYYRVNQELVTHALQILANDTQTATSRSGETQQQAADKPNDRRPTNPTASRTAGATSNKGTKPTSEPTAEHTHTDLTADAAVPTSKLVINLADLIPPTPEGPVSVQAILDAHANASLITPTSLDTVPGAAAGQPSKTVQRLMAVYNAHRKHLPAAESASTGREKALKRLIGQFGGPEAAALALADATQEVAADEFWMGKGWGLDNLLPKIAGKVDAWRARGQPVMGADPAAPPNVAFHVGQRVSYKRDQYDVEHVGATYIDLYDPVNGSSRIAFASSDFVAVKAIGGTV